MAWGAIIKAAIQVATRAARVASKLRLNKISRRFSKVSIKGKAGLKRFNLFRNNSSDITSLFSSGGGSSRKIPNQSDLDKQKKEDESILPSKSESRNPDEILQDLLNEYDIDENEVKNNIETSDSQVEDILDDSNDRLKRSKKALDNKHDNKEINDEEYITNLLSEHDKEHTERLRALNISVLNNNNNLILSNAEMLTRSIKAINDQQADNSQRDLELVNNVRNKVTNILGGLKSTIAGQKQTSELIRDNENSVFSKIKSFLGRIVEIISAFDPIEIILTSIMVLLNIVTGIYERFIQPIDQMIGNTKDWLLDKISWLIGSEFAYETYKEYVSGNDREGNEVHKIIEYRIFGDGTIKRVDVYDGPDECPSDATEIKNPHESLWHRNAEAFKDKNNDRVSIYEKESLPVEFNQGKSESVMTGHEEDKISNSNEARISYVRSNIGGDVADVFDKEDIEDAENRRALNDPDFVSSNYYTDADYFKKLPEGATNPETLPEFNAKEAADSATRHAHSKSQSKCGTYVRKALAEGFGRKYGALTFNAGPGAADFARVLPHYKFQPISLSTADQVGDIMITLRAPGVDPPVEYGHAAIFNGTNWVSDFVQSHPNVYHGRHLPFNDTYFKKFRYNPNFEIDKSKLALAPENINTSDGGESDIADSDVVIDKKPEVNVETTTSTPATVEPVTPPSVTNTTNQIASDNTNAVYDYNGTSYKPKGIIDIINKYFSENPTILDESSNNETDSTPQINVVRITNQKTETVIEAPEIR